MESNMLLFVLDNGTNNNHNIIQPVVLQHAAPHRHKLRIKIPLLPTPFPK